MGASLAQPSHGPRGCCQGSRGNSKGPFQGPKSLKMTLSLPSFAKVKLFDASPHMGLFTRKARFGQKKIGVQPKSYNRMVSHYPATMSMF